MIDGRGRRPVELGQVTLCLRIGNARRDGFQVCRHRRTFASPIPKGMLRALYRLVSEGILAGRLKLHRIQIADGLPCGRHQAPDAVDLVAKELQAHGVGALSWIYVHIVTVDAKGAWLRCLAQVPVAGREQRPADLLIGHLLAHLVAKGLPKGHLCRRHPAQKRPGAGYDNARLAGGQACQRLSAGAQHRHIGLSVFPGQIFPHGIALHLLQPQPGLKGAGRTVCQLLAGDHIKTGPGIFGPQAGKHQRAAGLAYRKRGVLMGCQRLYQRRQVGVCQKLFGDTVNDHGRRPS